MVFGLVVVTGFLVGASFLVAVGFCVGVEIALVLETPTQQKYTIIEMVLFMVKVIQSFP